MKFRSMTINHGIFERVIEGGLIFVVVFTPLAFGAVHVGAYTLMELTVIFLLIVWMLKVLVVGHKLENRGIQNHRSLYVPLFLFIGFVLFQMLPLPPPVLKHLSPKTYELYQQTLPGWPSEVSGGPIDSENSTNSVLAILNSQLTAHSWRSISIYRHASRKELFRILAYIGVFFLIINNLVTERQIKRFVVTIMVTGTVVAFLGILQALSGVDSIYWFWRSVHWGERPPGFFGPYVNRNHFAGYMEMVIPLSIGYLISYLSISNFQGGDWRYRLSALESRISKNLLIIFVIVVMITGLFLSLSRGGIMSFLVSMTFLINLLLFFPRSRKRGSVASLISIFSISALFLIWLGIGPVLERLSTLKDPDTVSPLRPVVYSDTINIVKDFPLFGTGLGTFENIYPRYKTAKTDLFFEHAHNDYLELLSDTGFFGALFLIGAILFFLVVIVKRWTKRRYPFAVGITLGGTAGIVAILFHSATDFNMHIPANAMMFFILLALSFAVVQMNTHRRKD
ncbi:MAG: O-antigen ligase family protein [Pseudomonadota bacterium]